MLITEIPEFCGGEHLFAARAKDAATGRKVFEYVDWYKQYAAKFGTTLGDNPSPGNIAGGLTTIEEKALGNIEKTGTKPVVGVGRYTSPEAMVSAIQRGIMDLIGAARRQGCGRFVLVSVPVTPPSCGSCRPGQTWMAMRGLVPSAMATA